MSSPERIGVAVISPSPTLRVGLSAILQSLESIEVTTQAASLEELGELPARTSVLILSSWEALPMPVESEPGAGILIQTSEPGIEQMGSQLMEARFAWGLLPLDAAPDELLAAIRALSAGLWVGAPGLVRRALGKQSPPWRQEEDPELIEALTERETEVLQQVAQGLSNKQIAFKLGISENTVKYHIASIYSKMGVNNRTEAVRLGARMGLVTL